MNVSSHDSGRPKLLVSVRSAREAQIALAGGADFVDVKEPARGPLGPADAVVVVDVVKAVGGRAPISVAAGELLDRRSRAAPVVCGVKFVKWGLAGCGALPDWSQRWRRAVAALVRDACPVAVVYADWRLADAPRPELVLDEAVAAGCDVLLVDTWAKSTGSLFDRWSPYATAQFCRRVHDARLAVALAGSLEPRHLAAALDCRPDVIAVRGAACEGGRSGRVHRARVRALRRAMEGHVPRADVAVPASRGLERAVRRSARADVS